MRKRLFSLLLLAACTVALTASANAQIAVSSHTNIETLNGQEHIVVGCQTLMQDPLGPSNYPGGVAAVCTLNQFGVAIQTLPVCIGQPNANCPPVTLGVVSPGTLYQTTATHGLIMQILTKGCTQNGVAVDCLSDPLSYGINAIPALPVSRQFPDNGVISPPFPPVGPSFWTFTPGNNDALIASTAETTFMSAQVDPFVWHAKANDPPRTFTLAGNQNANWTFTGSGGTTVPGTPSQGLTIDFHAPSTVPVQQVDTLTGCKVDQSHGADCASAQIIVEMVKVDIPAGNPNDIPRPDNSTELLGGDMAQYKATVIQGATTLVDAPVTWNFSDPSGLSLITVSPGGVGSRGFGFVTVAPQSVFQNNVFVVNITATAVDQNGNPIDPAVAVSAPFNIRISPATVTMTTVPSPGLNDTSTVFRADPGRKFHFEANVVGPQNPNNRVITIWDEDFIPNSFDFSPPGQRLVDPNNSNAMDYVIFSPPPKGNISSTTIKACVGGHLDSSILGSLGRVGATCAFFPMVFSAPVFPTSLPQTINSGESTFVSITGTGFGAAPVLSFSDPTVTFTPASISGPDANGVTTVTGTMIAAPVPPLLPPLIFKIIPVTITSSLPPPSIPVNQGVRVRPVTTSAAVTPVNPTLLVSQSQQFTPSLGCQTFGGFACTVPQTSTCSLFTGSGTMTTGCLYTAPATLAAQTQVQAQACFTFGNVCTTFPINLIPVAVSVSPAAVSPGPGQSQQFQTTVTNVPNNNQGVTWSINPAVGTITAAGLYTAPAVISTAQTISVTACSAVDPAQCGSATVTLVPPDFGLSVAQSTGLSTPFAQNGFNLTVTPIGAFTGNVTLSATLPPSIGMSAVFSPPTITGSGTSVATFPVLTSTPVGTYPVTIMATSGGLVHSVQITVTVAQPTLSLTVSPPQTAAAGQTVTYTFAVSWTNFFGSVSVNETGIPAGSTITPTVGGTFFAPGTGSLIFTTPATLAPGDYNITFTATGGGLVTVGSSSLNVALTKTASTTLTIPQPPPPPPPPPPRCTTRDCLPQS